MTRVEQDALAQAVITATGPRSLQRELQSLIARQGLDAALEELAAAQLASLAQGRRWAELRSEFGAGWAALNTRAAGSPAAATSSAPKSVRRRR